MTKNQNKIKLLIVNVTANTGSTGRIAEEIGLLAKESGYEVRLAYGRTAINSRLPLIKIGGKLNTRWHGLKSLLLDAHGFGSSHATKLLIKKLESWEPDIINIHNLHGYYINIEILFDYLKKKQIPIVWTLHDCWPFTGHCSFFDRYDCRKWETVCHECPNIKGYPESWFFDRSKTNYLLKNEIFNGLKNVTIVTPSEWLASHVKHSFLKNYPVKVIYNGLDLDVFCPIKDENIFQKYGFVHRIFVLGVASTWDKRKGLDDFIVLRKLLSVEIQIVLVGLSAEQTLELPSGIIAISRTENVKELAAFYSAASVFVNPTYIDNFPTTNIEALACGTPVITYRTGGSPEAIDAKTGFIVEKANVEGLKNAIENVLLNGKQFYCENCRRRAVKLFNKKDRYEDYLELMESMVNKKQIENN